MDYNEDIVKYLINAYKENEQLWNPAHPNYKYNAKREVFDILSEPLYRDMNHKLNGNEIYAILCQLRGRFCREFAKVQRSNGKYKPRLWYYNLFDFLKNVISRRRSVRKVHLI